MAYTYLLDLYSIIEQQVQDICIQLKDNLLSSEQKAFLEGKADMLNEFKIFLSGNLEIKLPKRIRKKLNQPDSRKTLIDKP